MDSQLATIIVAIVGAIGGGLITGVFNRRKTSAEAESTIAATATSAAKELISEYKKQADQIQNENKHLLSQISELRQADRENKAELRVHSGTLENLNAQVLRYRLIIAILSMQFRTLGYEPLIHPDNIDALSVNELNDIASSLNSLQIRREQQAAAND